MISFARGFRPDSEAFAIFVTEKYEYKDKKGILPQDTVQKINLYLRTLRQKSKEEEINFFDISEKKKCFVIKIKKKYENSYFEEIGGSSLKYLPSLLMDQ